MTPKELGKKLTSIGFASQIKKNRGLLVADDFGKVTVIETPEVKAEPPHSTTAGTVAEEDDVTPVSAAGAEAPFLRDLRDAGKLAQNMLELIISVILSGKKVTLAFHKYIAGQETARLRAILNRLEELKKKEGFDKLLKNLVLIPSFSTAEELTSQFDAKDVDMNNAETNAVFVFAPSSAGIVVSGSAIRRVAIDEERDFNASVHYYPLFEIVTIALAKYHSNYDADKIRRILSELGVEPEKLNIKDIVDGTDGTPFLVFTLIPKAARHDPNERADRYSLIEKFIKSAA
jgi:hypothetical protein